MTKKSRRIVIILVIAAIALAVTAAAATYNGENSVLYQLGKLFSQTKESTDKGESDILAQYNGEFITRSMIDYQEKAKFYDEGAEDETEKDIVRRLLSAKILLSMAREKGMTPTQKEIDEYMTGIKNGYASSQKSAEMIDEYCKGAGISVDEYFAIIEEQSNDILTWWTIKKQFTDDFFAQKGWKEGDYPEDAQKQMNKAFEEYRSKLLEEHKDEIKYYI